MKQIFFKLLALITVLLLTACEPKLSNMPAVATKPVKQTSAISAQTREEADKLTQVLANERKSRIANVAYTLDIDLVSLPNAYQGEVMMSFDLSSNDHHLTVDFTGGSVLAVVVNGTETAIDYSGFFVNLPAELLVQGSNQIMIQYQHPYDQDGTGLHRYIDPQDGKTYLYTYLWPYYANRLFPHFDQPNLKATYELTVRAQQDWQVLSAEKEDFIKDDDGTKIWYFPPSKKFSSYIFSLHAGPYRVWEDMAGEVPIRLFSRQTMAEYVPVDEWMGYTKMGLKHYKKYFDIAYPFEKYDQVLVPDFNIGAMENVAAVTFTENVIQKGPSNRFQRQRRAAIILHEMAHMWFGNLVTKDWWNGLWLNESFASLMASIAVAELPEFSDFWHDFYLNTNLVAIEADNMVSTHPIEVPVPSTDDFFSVFDSITYQKGSSVLNQLSHYVGQENFRLGVSKYLKKHAWDNTELIDFMASQAQQSGIEFDQWSQDWLYQAGVNKIKVNIICDGDKISNLTVQQFAPDNLSTLRSHKIQLALFNEKMKPYIAMPVNIVGARTEITAVLGQDCPFLVYPNYEGWGYVEVELDDLSKNHASAGINQTPDPLLRSMLWTSLLDDPNTLPDAVIDALSAEQNDRVMAQVQSGLIKKINLLERQGNQQFKAVSQQLEEMLWRHLNSADSDSQLSMRRFKDYVSVVRSESGQENLLRLLTQQIELLHLTVSQEFRWAILHRLAVLNHPQIKGLLEQEKNKDTSDGGQLGAIAVDAALPDAAIKQKWINNFMTNDNALPLSHQRVAMASLFPANQGALQTSYLPELLNALPMIRQNRDNYYQRAFAQSLFAGVCTADALQKMEKALNKDKLGTTLYRYLAENIQLAQHCVAEVTKDD